MYKTHQARAFSLIELLVALSILAIVAAIIVPQFLNIRAQAQLQVVDQNLKTISDATAMWQSLGGMRAAAPDTNETFKFLKFLSTPSDGSDPKRGFGADNTYPTDSIGPSGSSTVTIPVYVAAAASAKPSAQSDPDGFYGRRPTAITGTLVQSTQNLYNKQGSQVYAIDGDLAAAIFIRTGIASGSPEINPATLNQ